MKKYLVSTAVLPLCVGKEFFDYTGIIEAYKLLDMDGIELVFLPEWDSLHPPLTPTSADWSNTPKIKCSELVDICIKNELPVPVVHINRDVGTMLCSDNKEAILEGQNVLNDNLLGASLLQSEIAVLHMWDTYHKSIDLNKLFKKIYEVSGNYRIRIAIENIPISDKKLTQEKAWEFLNDVMPPEYGFTMDLNWCSLYNNFAELKKFRDKILNVHVQGYLSLSGENNYTLLPRVGNLDIINSLSELCKSGYDGYITLEMNRPGGENDFRKALEIIRNNS